MKSFFNRYILLFFLLIDFIFPTFADTVNVSDGGSFTGIILSETPEYIELDLGTGTMSIQRKYVTSVHKSTELERELIRKEWRQKYFLNKRYVPAGKEDMVNRFNRLRQQRASAMRASAELKVMKAKEIKKQKKLEDIKKQYRKANQKLKKANIKYNAVSYNKLVQKVNSLAAEINMLTDELAEPDYGRQSEVISDYIAEVDSFADDIRRQLQMVNSNDSSYYFYKSLLQNLEQYNNDFPEDLIKSRMSGNATYISVRINNRVTGNFILDTGADTVTISEAFAKKAGIKTAGLSEVKMRVADGRVVTGHSVILDSVQVGRFRSRNVPAVIMPGAGRGHDGLLGMSFLRDYIVNLKNGKLSLRKLD